MANTKKILMLGRFNVGKTSMKTVVFENRIPQSTALLSRTNHGKIEEGHYRILNNRFLVLLDFAAMHSFDVKSDIYEQKKNKELLKDTVALIYFFDATVPISSCEKCDFFYYRACLDALELNCLEIPIYCFINKMDLVEPYSRERIFRTFEEKILESTPTTTICKCYPTSIYDESFCGIWSKMLYPLITNIDRIHSFLREVADIHECDEICLIDSTSSLVIVNHVRRRYPKNSTRHAVIAYHIKKLQNSLRYSSLKYLKTTLNAVEVRNSRFSLQFQQVTNDIFVMICNPYIEVTGPLITCNLEKCRNILANL